MLDIPRITWYNKGKLRERTKEVMKWKAKNG
jgi:hypothetical protein